LGEFAIGAWVALLWQHNVNPSYKLASILRYDNINHQSLVYLKLEMWANAQRDGRPADYMWRPLFNAAKFG